MQYSLKVLIASDNLFEELNGLPFEFFNGVSIEIISIIIKN